MTAVTVTFYGRKCERSGKSVSLFQGESINLPKKSKERQEHMKKRRLLPSELGKVTDVPDRKAIH